MQAFQVYVQDDAQKKSILEDIIAMLKERKLWAG